MYNKPGKLEQLEHVQEMKNAKKLAKIFGQTKTGTNSFNLLENVLNLDFYQLARPKICDGSQIHEITLGRE